MCGEIEDWQIAHTVCIRLPFNSNYNHIQLNSIFQQCEEVRLDEVYLKNFNGGVSTAAYLDFDINGMSSGYAGNEAQKGLLIAFDSLNPLQIYSRPKVIARGMTTLQSFDFTVRLPGGAVPTWTEAAFMLTVVCRRSADSIAEIRKLRQLVDRPNIRDGVTSNNFVN